MTNVLVFLNSPTQAVIRCAEDSSTRKTKVYADYNAFFGYGSITNSTDNIELISWGSHQVLDKTGNPNLASDGYHLAAGVSDDRLIDGGIATSVAYDIDGDARPQGPKPDIDADELFLPKGTLILLR